VQRALKLAIPQMVGDIDLFARERIEIRVVDTLATCSGYPLESSVYLKIASRCCDCFGPGRRDFSTRARVAVGVPSGPR